MSSDQGRRSPASLPIPFLGLLDRYVIATYLRIFALSVVALCGLAYLSSFIDLSDEVFRGDATWGSLGSFLAFITPQSLYFVLPISVLLATLITIGLLTRNSELVIMKACGISLYRIALPLLFVGVLMTGILAGLQEGVLGSANQQAAETRSVITGDAERRAANRRHHRWVAGSDGDIYHYEMLDEQAQTIGGLTVYEFDHDMTRIVKRTFAKQAAVTADAGGTHWEAEGGWVRSFENEAVQYATFDRAPLTVDPLERITAPPPDPEFMNYSALRRHIADRQADGFDTVAQRVALERKVAFPFVTLIMTLIAVPFAVTTGTKGAMYGIGAGLVLAFSYWGALSVFAALGAAGLLAPLLAAWAANLLFAAAAIYLVLTVRT